MHQPIGRRIVNLDPILAAFEAQEGETQQIIGKTGMGKTYEATRRALLYLYSGYTVYTTWRLNLPDYYDEREHFWPIVRNLFLFRGVFHRFDLKNNWHYLDLETFADPKTKAVDVRKLSEFIAALTDCILMMDEGQDVFDSHKRAGEAARQSITRARHMHKTLIIISQRAHAVDVTARANATYFYKCEKLKFPFLPFLFRVYRSDEIDEVNSLPLWERLNSQGQATWKAPVWHSAYARQWIYDAYDSWYLRQKMVRSQDIKLEAFSLTFGERFSALGRLLYKGKKPLRAPLSPAVPFMQPEPPRRDVHKPPLARVLTRSMDGILPT